MYICITYVYVSYVHSILLCIVSSYPVHPEMLFDLSSVPNLLDTCMLCIIIMKEEKEKKLTMNRGENFYRDVLFMEEFYSEKISIRGELSERRNFF